MRTLLLGLLAGLMLPAASWGQQTPLGADEEERTLVQEHPVYYGVGIRVRGLFVPQSAFERYVEVAPSGVSRPSLGFELFRRRGSFEASIGVSWANLSPKDGIWLDDIDHNPSLVEFDGFSWIGLDVNATWKHLLNPNVAVRYGIGVGLGFVRGTVLETDYECPPNRYERAFCMVKTDAEPDEIRNPLDLPALLPIVNAVLGLQYSPTQQVAFNLDVGLHTALFAGVGIVYFFPAR